MPARKRDRCRTCAALSGYLTAADGEPLVFSILANNFEAPAEVVNRAIDAIVYRLANYGG